MLSICIALWPEMVNAIPPLPRRARRGTLGWTRVRRRGRLRTALPSRKQKVESYIGRRSPISSTFAGSILLAIVLRICLISAAATLAPDDDGNLQTGTRFAKAIS